MAKILVSGNLNIYGNAGAFETDRSTWGFGDNSYIITRSSSFAFAGLYSAFFINLTGGIVSTNMMPISWAGVVGKKYVIRAMIRTPSGNELGAAAEKFTFRPSVTNPYLGLTEIDFIEKTILESTDVWVQIESSVLVTALPSGPFSSINLVGDVAGYAFGKLYVDKVEVYEYIDVYDVCDVAINTAATIIVNETSPGATDGSITVLATGTGSLEYSKNGGATWQVSNVFANLTTGIYVVRVRQVLNPGCFAEYPFSVASAAPTHDFTTAVTNESFAGLNDGAISITPTGPGAPFDYSIDAGVTFQVSVLFQNLAPGIYSVVVRNAVGQSVTHGVVVGAGSAEPETTYHSKNPITIGKAAPSGWEALINFRLYNDVRVEDVADSGIYSSKLKVALPPDSNGLVTFYLNEAFRDAFTFVPPAVNANQISRLTDRIKRFKNFSGSLQNTEVNPGALTPSSANLVLWGGVSKFHFPAIQYFTNYIVANKKFLTWAPREKYVERTQEDYLTFYCYGNYTTLKVIIKAYYDDATNATATVATLAGTGMTKLYQVPAGPANTGALLINPAKNLLSYELWLTNQADEVITEVRTYYIEESHPRTRFYMFLNSLGGYEVLRFTGVQTDKVTFARELIQKFLPHNYNPLDGEFSSNQVTHQRQMNIGSGFIKGRLAKEWHEYLEDFISSPIVYDVTDGDRYPIVITSGEHISEDQNYERFIRVEARDAYDNESFTPKVI